MKKILNEINNKNNRFIVLNGMITFIAIFLFKVFWFNENILLLGLSMMGFATYMIIMFGGEMVFSLLYSLKNTIQINNIIFSLIYNVIFFVVLILFSFDEFQINWSILYTLEQLLGLVIGKLIKKHMSGKYRKLKYILLFSIILFIMFYLFYYTSLIRIIL